MGCTPAVLFFCSRLAALKLRPLRSLTVQTLYDDFCRLLSFLLLETHDLSHNASGLWHRTFSLWPNVPIDSIIRRFCLPRPSSRLLVVFPLPPVSPPVCSFETVGKLSPVHWTWQQMWCSHDEERYSESGGKERARRFGARVQVMHGVVAPAMLPSADSTVLTVFDAMKRTTVDFGSGRWRACITLTLCKLA